MTKAQTTGSHVTRSAALVALFLAADKLLGVLRERAVARAFGDSAYLDAYIAAFEVPEGLNFIVTGAALTTALIPLLETIIDREDRGDVWRFVSAVVNWVIIAVGGFSIVAAIAARPIIVTLAPGFGDDPTQVALAARLMRLVLIQTMVFSLSTVVTGTLQAHRHFFLPALGPLLYTLGRIFGAVVLAPRFGIFGLAWGGIIGSVGHLLIKTPWLIRERARWMPVLHQGDMVDFLRLMVPRMLSMSVTYINFILPTTLGSFLAAGAISAYEYGWKLMQLPETIIGTALGIVVLPTLASLAAKGEQANLRQTFGWALRLVLALSIPAAAGLILLGHPVTAILFQGGEFDAATTDRVYRGLQFFALGLVAHAALEVVARLFYARRDMWPPLGAALAGLATNAAVGWVLLHTLEHGAIALANSLGACLQVAILLPLAGERIGGIEGNKLLQSLGRTLAATVAMAAVIWAIQMLAGGMGIIVSTALALGAGVITYFVAALLLGSEEIVTLPRLLLNREKL
jgi:putative peptidoglycan lipid II flippase